LRTNSYLGLPMGQTAFIDRIKRDWQETAKKFDSPQCPVPSTLMLELTNRCNLQCIMCQNSTMRRKKGFMDVELAERTINDAAGLGMHRIGLYTTGESLLHPAFVEILKAASRHGMTSYLTTNGLPLTRQLCEQIVEEGLESVKVSIDGVSKGEYEKLRRGGNYDRLMENLETLRRVRDRHYSPMKIYGGAVVTRLNEENIHAFRTTYGHLVDAIYLSPLVNQSGKMGKAFQELRPTDHCQAAEWRPCKMLWDRVVVSWEGHLTACCVDYEMDMTYGTFFTDGLEGEWNGLKMRQWRSQHLRGEVDSLILCAHCNAPYIQQVEILDTLNQKY